MNTPTKFISTVSSMHPIDLAAFTMMYAIYPFKDDTEILILFMQELDMPSELAHRVLTARSSVPTPLLLLEKEEVFRQVFVPLADKDTSLNVESVLLAIDLYINAVKSNSLKVADAIEKRKKILCEALEILPQRDAENLLLNLVQFLLEDIIHIKVSIGSYDRYLKNETGQKKAIDALIHIISEVNSFNERGFQYGFTKGGYIGISFKDTSAQLEYFETFEHKTIFWNKSQTVYLEIDRNYPEPALYTHNGREEGNFTLELRGPLHMIYQAQLGSPVDVPWYFDSVTSADSRCAYIGIESITPISVSSLSRTSSWVGGENLRLNPGGYTLLDYDHPNILTYIASVIQSDTLNFNAYEDWRHIYNNYPVSRQRLLKSQSGIPQYCDLRLRELRKRIVHGDETCLKLLASPSLFEIPNLGITTIALMTIIKFIRDAMATPNVVWSVEQFDLLHSLGFIRNSMPALDNINYQVREIKNHIGTWIQRITLPETILNSAPKAGIISLIQYLENQKTIKRLISVDQASDLVSLDACYRILQKVLYMYYKAVVALGGTVFKANLWTCWLLLGSEDYLKVCKNLIDQRDIKQFNLSARVWTLRTDSTSS